MIEDGRNALALERKKRQDGRGNDSVGPLLPEYLWKAGFHHIQAYLPDRIQLLTPLIGRGHRKKSRQK